MQSQCRSMASIDHRSNKLEEFKMNFFLHLREINQTSNQKWIMTNKYKNCFKKKKQQQLIMFI